MESRGLLEFQVSDGWGRVFETPESCHPVRAFVKRPVIQNDPVSLFEPIV